MVAKGAAPYVAHERALQLLDGQLMRQATMLAYNDAWLLILLCFLAVVPAVFLLRKRRGPAAVVDAH
jgi:DHA2 family multidrug resistance protein